MNSKIKLVIVFAISFLFNLAHAQLSSNKFTLSVYTFKSNTLPKAVVSGIHVSLIDKNQKILCAGETDSIGLLFFDTLCVPSDFDTLRLLLMYKGEKLFIESELVNPNINSESMRSFDFIKEFSIPYQYFRNYPEPISVFSTVHSTDTFFGFDSVAITSFLANYPSICVQIAQSKHPDESDGVAQERMVNLKNEISKITNRVDRFKFSEEIHVLSDAQLIQDSRPRFDFSVYNFDCD